MNEFDHFKTLIENPAKLNNKNEWNLRNFCLIYLDKYSIDFLLNAIEECKPKDKERLNNILRSSQDYIKQGEQTLYSFLNNECKSTEYYNDLRKCCASGITKDKLTLFIKRNISRPNFIEKCATIIAYSSAMNGPQTRIIYINHMSRNIWPDYKDAILVFYPILRQYKSPEESSLYLKEIYNYIEQNFVGESEITPSYPQTFKNQPKTFDDFSFLLKEIENCKKFSRTYHYSYISIGNHIYYRDYVQNYPIFSNYYISQFGIDSISKHIDELKNKEQVKHLQALLFLYKRYHDFERNKFKEFLKTIQYEIFFEKLNNYIPVSLSSLKWFIKENINDSSTFAAYAGLLLTYYQKEAIPGIIFDHSKVQSYLSDSDTEFYFNDIIQYKNYFCYKGNIPMIDQIKTNNETEMVLHVSWHHVTFMDGKLKISLFLEENKELSELYIICPASFASYNKLKSYFIEKVPPIQILVQNNKCVKNLFDFEKYIETIVGNENKNSPDIIMKDKTLFDIKTYTRGQFSSSHQNIKSKYIQVLCELQSDNYKIFQCFEKTTSYSQKAECVFIFTLDFMEFSNSISIILENINPSRSTLVFWVKRDLYPRGLEIIIDFMASLLNKKRSRIIFNEFKFNDESIVAYKRIVHSSFNKWYLSLINTGLSDS